MAIMLHEKKPWAAMNLALFAYDPSGLQTRSNVLDINRVQRQNTFKTLDDIKPTVLVANLAVSRWKGLICEIRPLIGEKAVLLLFQRCLSVSSKIYPWLLFEQSTVNIRALLLHLHSHLIIQPCIIGVAAHRVLWRCCCVLLKKLFGKKLARHIIKKSVMPKHDPKTTSNFEQPGYITHNYQL